MAIIDQIQQRVQQLPVTSQEEVLDFVEHLLSKADRETVRQEEKRWNELSLTAAMRGLENENGPEYTTDDLKVIFK